MNDTGLISRPACLLCGGHGKPLYSGLHDRLFGASGEYGFLQCVNPECGLVWLDPAPDMAHIGEAYASYFTHADSAPAWRSRNLLYLAWRRLGAVYRLAIRPTRIGRARTRAAANYLDGVTPGRVLDVGCGDGSWMVRMREMGWEVEGQETDQHSADQARNTRGLTVHVGLLDALHLPAARYDAITMSHVIEHVHEPVAVLAECLRLLKPGGRLIALTPNVRSFGHRQFGRDWVALDPPRHLVLFSADTLARAAQRAGFRKTEVTTSAVRAQFISAGSEDIRRTGRHDMSRAYSLRQLTRAVAFELRAWRELARDTASGDELILEAFK